MLKWITPLGIANLVPLKYLAMTKQFVQFVMAFITAVGSTLPWMSTLGSPFLTKKLIIFIS